MLVSPSVENPEVEWRWGRKTALILVLITIVFKHTLRMWGSQISNSSCLYGTPISGIGREIKFPHSILPKMGRKRSFHSLWAGGGGGGGGEQYWERSSYYKNRESMFPKGSMLEKS